MFHREFGIFSICEYLTCTAEHLSTAAKYKSAECLKVLRSDVKHTLLIKCYSNARYMSTCCEYLTIVQWL